MLDRILGLFLIIVSIGVLLAIAMVAVLGEIPGTLIFKAAIVIPFALIWGIYELRKSKSRIE